MLEQLYWLSLVKFFFRIRAVLQEVFESVMEMFHKTFIEELQRIDIYWGIESNIIFISLLHVMLQKPAATCSTNFLHLFMNFLFHR